MSLGTRYKDPDETRLFTFDWSKHLVNDTIASYTVTVPAGLVKESEALVEGDKKVSVLLSGGTANTQYQIVNKITTSGGEVLERTGIVAVRQM